MTDSPDFKRRRLCLALAGLPLLAACKPTQRYGLPEHRAHWFERHAFAPLAPLPSRSSFVLGVLPDTQYYSENNHEMQPNGRRVERYGHLGYPPALAFHAQTHWLAHNAAALNLLRLDPQSRHTHPQIQQVRDLRAMWPVVEAAAKLQAPEPGKLLELTASKVKMQKQEGDADGFGGRAMMHRRSYMYPGGPGAELTTPGAAIANQGIVSAVTTMFEASK